MNKKAQSSMIVWIGLGVFILFIVAMIAVFMILGQSDDEGEAIPQENLMKLYLIGVNSVDESEQVAANYRIEANKTVVSEGVLSENSITEIRVPREQLRLICWADGYYLGRTYKIFSQEELSLNSSRSVCNMKKIGEIKVEHEGELVEGETMIKLNISSEGNYGKLKICNRWSAGIISAVPTNSELLCDDGIWLNWSHYDSTSKKYTMLPETYFRCGDCIYPYCDWATRCSSVKGQRCQVYSMKTPNRYAGKVDNCYYPGVSLHGDSVILEYTVKTSGLNVLDEIEFFIMDSDRRFNPSENMLTYMTENNGENIGAEDTIYKISYTGSNG